MPFVRRRVTSDSDVTMYKRTHDALLYVEPGAVRDGDKPVDAADLSPRQRAELHRLEGGGKPAPATAPAGPTKAPETAADPADEWGRQLEAFEKMNAKDAADAVRQCTDPDLRALFFEAEQEREDGPRKTVLDAFPAPE